MGDRPDRNCSTTYNCATGPFSHSLWSTFPTSLAVNQLLPNGSAMLTAPTCVYPGLASYVHSPKSIDVLVPFLQSQLQVQAGFDGMYLDGYLRERAYSFSTDLKFDSNGDGAADSNLQMAAQYSSWAPVFVYKLREAWGGDAIILANSAGPLSDPDINGLTIEMESCLDEESCTNALLAQNAVARSPSVSVLWLTHSESMPPQEQCQRAQQMQQMYPWIQAGTDFFDGSHVVC